MAEGCDELEYNRFYQLLQTKFIRTYNEAQRKCFVICIPCSTSLNNIEEIGQEFIDLHILRPSPFFKGQYFTSEGSKSKTLLLENNLFTAKQGFQRQFQVKVLSEEQGYNKELKPFRILVIEQPFIKPRRKSSCAFEVKKTSAAEEIYTLDPTHDECVQYLNKFPECSKVVETLKTECRLLSENYMIIKGFLPDVEAKLKELWMKITKMYLEEMSLPHANDQRVQNNVYKAVESFVLGKIHHKLLPVIREERSAQDTEIRNKLAFLKPLPPEALGVDEQYCCPLPDPIRELNQITSCSTPLDILLCMRTTFESVTHNIAMGTNRDTKDVLHLTSDDYISILLYVIAQADELHLSTLMYYVEHFHWCSPEMDQLGYSYVTFQAILQYLSTLDAEYVAQKYRTKSTARQAPKKTSGIEDILEEQPATQLSRREQRLQRITKMLEDSTKEFAAASKDSPAAKIGYPRTTRPKNTTPLGDFLSSLNDDSSPSFGKQN